MVTRVYLQIRFRVRRRVILTRPKARRATPVEIITARCATPARLEALPESVFRLAHLRFLHINNQPTELPESIGRLAYLQELTLVSNA